MWMASSTGSTRGGFWGFRKKSVELSPVSEEDGWLSLARRSQASGLVTGATHVGGADGKASIGRLCLSPYVEKPSNSKVIKSFVPELRSVFYVSGFLCSMYICYEHSMYVTHIRIWLWYSLGEILPLCREADGVIYSPNWVDNILVDGLFIVVLFSPYMRR